MHEPRACTGMYCQMLTVLRESERSWRVSYLTRSITLPAAAAARV